MIRSHLLFRQEGRFVKEVLDSPASTLKGLQSLLAEVGEPEQNLISPYRYSLYRRVTRMKTLLRKGHVETVGPKAKHKIWNKLNKGQHWFLVGSLSPSWAT